MTGGVIYLLQVDVGLHDLLECVTGQRGVVAQEVRQCLIILQKVLQFEICGEIRKRQTSAKNHFWLLEKNEEQEQTENSGQMTIYMSGNSNSSRIQQHSYPRLEDTEASLNRSTVCVVANSQAASSTLSFL